MSPLKTFSKDEIEEKLLNDVWIIPNGCWVKPVNEHNNGYSRISLGRARGYCYSHIVAHEQWIGPVPTGKVVMHKCDNRACINPQHIKLGTQAENMQDMKNKGRALKDMCYQGHPLIRYIDKNGYSRCVTCRPPKKIGI